MGEERDLSAEKHNLLIEETRQSFFQLENLTTALDNKAYGMIAFNTILISIFGYIIANYFNYALAYIAPILLMGSLIILLFCVYPRNWFRPNSEKSLNLFDELGFKPIAGQLAVNYASYEKYLYKKYYKKVKYLKWSFKLTIAAIVIEFLAIAWLIIFDP
jgi:hypothetical protein